MAVYLNDLIGHSLTTIESVYNREYLEFSERLYALLNAGQISLDDFIAATNSDDRDRISLCTFERRLDSLKVDTLIETIFSLRNHLLQVFMHPKLHLREIQQVLPIEVVKRIGHESIRHLAAHSEHWASVRISGLIPARMLARSLEDEYAIYENIVAKALVDRLHLLMRKKKKELEVIEYSFVAKDSIYFFSGQQSIIHKAYKALFK
jgi:hypothetical protein